MSRQLARDWWERTEEAAGIVRVLGDDFAGLRQDLAALLGNTLAQLEAALEAAGAPWTPGRRLSGR